MDKTVRNRLKRLEDASEGNYTEIIQLIKSGAFYDELTDDQKDMYCQYRDFDRQAFEDVSTVMLETMHIMLEIKPPKMTPEEERKHVAEVAKEIESILNAESAERT